MPKKKHQQKQGEGWKDKLARFAEEKLGQKGEMVQPDSLAESAETLEMNHTESIPDPAKAPYNFIPLNSTVVKADEIPGQGNCTFDKYHEDKHTGYIELTIETKTPLYIKDTLTEEEMKEKERLESDEKKYINPDFFSPAGKIRIPGSSLRGMIRTMVEIVSFGRFGFFEKDRKYHFRSFADRSLDLRGKYFERMLCGDGTTGYYQQVKAGYLVKDGTGFKIKPAKVINGCQFFRVEEDLTINKGVLSQKMARRLSDGKYVENRDYHFGFKSVRFTYNSPKKHTNHSRPLYYAEVTDICNLDETLSNSEEGALVYTGWMRGPSRRPRGKHLHWVIGPATGQKIEFLPGVIEDYKNDINRHEEANLLRHFKCNPKAGVPCFYIEENGKVKSFGHTGIFRLAYDCKLSDFLPNDMEILKGIDIAEAIFGNEISFAGRVFVEDAFLGENQTDVLMREGIPQILSTPKPTTFQHYLVQHEEIIEERDRNGNLRGYSGIQDYNDDTWLRGNKLYWHKSGDNWQETTILFSRNDFTKLLRDNNLTEQSFGESLRNNGQKKEVDLTLLSEDIKQIILKAIGIYETQHTKINAIKKSKTFIGKIRFENLSDVELGTLLFALDLPEGCCHKLGMGKPLGLGSIKISPKLFISNRKNRYESLFAEWDAPIPESTSPEKNIPHFKKEFEKYVLRRIGETEPDLWNVERMKELKAMLDFETGKNLEQAGKIRYMQIEGPNGNEFRDRKVLPKPTKV